jgi:hypothetical protein
VRQMEISKRLRAAQHEMNQLTAAQAAQPASDRVPTPGPSRQEVASLRDQVQELQNRIEQMQNQQQSDWALGLSDEPPPAYDWFACLFRYYFSSMLNSLYNLYIPKITIVFSIRTKNVLLLEMMGNPLVPYARKLHVPKVPQ